MERPLEQLVTNRSCLVGLTQKHFDFTSSEHQNETFLLDDGSVFDVFLYPVLEQDGSVESMICLARDVTEFKKVEQRIRQTEKMVAAGQLAAGIAHEINNPLGIILCYTDILKGEVSGSSQMMTDIEIIEKHAHSCQNIIADLLDFARTKKTEKKKTQINDLIKKILMIVRTQL